MTWFTPDVIDAIIAVVKAIVVLLAVVVCGALLSFVERRLLGWWQDRYGPNRVGPFGMFQIAADMLKMFFKEDWTPPFADKVIFTLAPVVAMSALLIAFAVIPRPEHRPAVLLRNGRSVGVCRAVRWLVEQQQVRPVGQPACLGTDRVL